MVAAFLAQKYGFPDIDGKQPAPPRWKMHWRQQHFDAAFQFVSLTYPFFLLSCANLTPRSWRSRFAVSLTKGLQMVGEG